MKVFVLACGLVLCGPLLAQQDIYEDLETTAQGSGGGADQYIQDSREKSLQYEGAAESGLTRNVDITKPLNADGSIKSPPPPKPKPSSDFKRVRYGFSLLYDNSMDFKLTGTLAAGVANVGGRWAPQRRKIVIPEYFGALVGVGVDVTYLISPIYGITLSGEYYAKSQDRLNDDNTVNPAGGYLTFNRYVDLSDKTRLKVFAGGGYSTMKLNIIYVDGQWGSSKGAATLTGGVGFEFAENGLFLDLLLRKANYKFNPPTPRGAAYQFDLEEAGYEEFMFKFGVLI